MDNIVRNDIYVDDCLSGGNSAEKVMSLADELELVLNRGGFSLKGVSFSKKPPLKSLSENGQSLNVAGVKWFPEEDILSLDVSELNFAKKSRGKKPSESLSKIPSKLTRRHCVSKVAEIYDLTGKVTPLTASMKIDLHELITRKLDWDDVLPDDLRAIWNSHFEMMKEINSIQFKRTIVPDDAVNLDINTIDAGDASKSLACVAIYARIKLRNGEYSCQLVFSRSKIIPDGMSMPRSELFAATINSHTGHIVRKAFQENFKSCIKLSDSQIVLYWIKNESKPLKQWVRNRVIEIRRLTSADNWYYVQTDNMIADIGTRKGAKIEDVNSKSAWFNGYAWMTLDLKDMPLNSISEVTLSTDDFAEAKKESPVPDLVNHHITQLNKDEISMRYKFSEYIVDPNKHRFEVVVRIVGYVLRFINKLREKKSDTREIQAETTYLSENEIQNAKYYFYRKAANEVKHFNKSKCYSKFSLEKDGILWYTGRILASDTVSIVGRFTDAMMDLSQSTFCVPVIDKNSPIAYSIINDVHWYDKDVSHRGIESVWRQVLKNAFIIEGRDIVKSIRKSCQRCRYLSKKHIEIIMGPVSSHNLTIAPAFYVTQVDLAGPFTSYSPHHKRTTVKVWFAVFCCATTTTINLKLMEDYSSSSFIQAFILLSSEVGYPKMLLPDEGSQLIKSCEDMRYNFKDVRNKLFVDSKVEFQACPVGGHNMHGRVERKIKEVKISIEKSFQNQRLSIMQWETVGAEVSNCINDMPLALGNVTAEFEVSDLITPNRLRLGRNNNRSPDGPIQITNETDKFLRSNQKIFDSWFEVWLLSHVPKLMQHPKWYKTSHDIQSGDVVLFVKHESALSNKYQYGIASSIIVDKDGVTRKVRCKIQEFERGSISRNISISTRFGRYT